MSNNSAEMLAFVKQVPRLNFYGAAEHIFAISLSDKENVEEKVAVHVRDV